jgi:drug/metabolite transporter (DMT)-like permease
MSGGKRTGLTKWLLLALLSLIWGSSFILIKKGLTGFGYVEAASIRLMAAGAVMLPVAAVQYRNVPRDRWPFVVLATLIGIFVPAYLFCFAQQHVQSAVAGMLNALTSVFTFIVGLLFFGTKYRAVHVAGLLLGFASAALLILDRSDASTLSVNAFAGLIVLATVFYGININLVKHKLRDVPALAITATSVSLAGLLAFLFACLPQPGRFAVAEGSNWLPLLALVALGVLSTALATLWYYKLLKMTSALFASSTTFVMPIVAVGWGLLDGEAFHWQHALSIAGILTAVVLLRKE